MRDKVLHVSKGFGFVEMPNKKEAQRAIANLQGEKLKGTLLIVRKTRPYRLINELRSK